VARLDLYRILQWSFFCSLSLQFFVSRLSHAENGVQSLKIEEGLGFQTLFLHLSLPILQIPTLFSPKLVCSAEQSQHGPSCCPS